MILGLPFTGEWTSVIQSAEGLGILGGVIGWWKSTRCHVTDCRHELRGHKLPIRRHGRFVHGHYKLCHVHHPKVPTSGKVRASHIITGG